VVHTAYGRTGDSDIGGIELIGYDPDTKNYRTYFSDSQANISNQDLSFRDGYVDVERCTRAGHCSPA
jgi:hypothetical protein